MIAGSMFIIKCCSVSWPCSEFHSYRNYESLELDNYIFQRRGVIKVFSAPPERNVPRKSVTSVEDLLLWLQLQEWRPVIKTTLKL